MSVLLVIEEETASEEGGEDDKPATEEPVVTPAEVLLCSVVGISNPKTMKLGRRVGEVTVLVMIDPGATLNFVSREVVEKARLRITNSGDFGVSSVMGTL